MYLVGNFTLNLFLVRKKLFQNVSFRKNTAFSSFLYQLPPPFSHLKRQRGVRQNWPFLTVLKQKIETFKNIKILW